MIEENMDEARARVEHLIKICHQRSLEHGISENLMVRDFLAAHVGAMWHAFDAAMSGKGRAHEL